MRGDEWRMGCKRGWEEGDDEIKREKAMRQHESAREMELVGVRETRRENDRVM